MKSGLFLLTAVPAMSLLAFDNLDVGTPGGCDQVVDRRGYALGYVERHEQAAWVQYRFTAAENLARNAERSEDFREDPAIRTGSALLADYRGSGYDRGHLAPAADMKFDPAAMSESFFLSNMSPQDHDFNAGIWNDIEKFVRYTVNIEKSLVVVTGPVFADGDGKIGRSGVTVPGAFYKIIYDETPPRKMIAFIVPNRDSDAPISSFVVSVDEVERRTGLDFFSKVQDSTGLEARSNVEDWRNLATWRRESRGGKRAAQRIPAQPRGVVGPSGATGAMAFGKTPHEQEAKARYERAPDRGPCWLSVNSDKRHNSKCPQFEKSRGRHCEKNEGKPAGCCGG